MADSAMLTQKYDALSQQYKTLQLEHEVYKNEIIKLRQEVIQLKEEKELYHQDSTEFANETAPLFADSLKNMSSTIDQLHLEKDQSFEQKKQYKDTIVQLKSDNLFLKEQNKKYQQSLEMQQNNHNKQVLQYEDRINELKGDIFFIGQENSQMATEFEKKSAEYDALRDAIQNQVESMGTVSSPQIPNDKTHRINFPRSLGPRQYDKSYLNPAELSDYDSTNDISQIWALVNSTHSNMTNVSNGTAALSMCDHDSDEKDVKDTDPDIPNRVKDLETECGQKQVVIDGLNKRMARLLLEKEKEPRCFGFFQ